MRKAKAVPESTARSQGLGSTRRESAPRLQALLHASWPSQTQRDLMSPTFGDCWGGAGADTPAL